jgi:hypothetical protein
MEISVSGMVALEEDADVASTWLVALTQTSRCGLAAADSSLRGGRATGWRSEPENLLQDTARKACDDVAPAMAIVVAIAEQNSAT